MNCKRVKNLISAYIDAELKPGLQKQVQNHINHCSHCRQLEEALKEYIIKPLKQSQRLNAPQGLWHKIQTALEEQKNKSLIPNFNSLPFFPFLRRHPAFALSTIASVVLIVSSVLIRLPIYRTNLLSVYIEEQADFLSYLENGQINELSESDNMVFETTIEQYLL